MSSFFAFLKRTPEAAAPDPMAQHLAAIKALKTHALSMAIADAHADKRMPTITDYFIACEMLGQEKSAELAEKNIVWNVKVYADLSGLHIDGFLMRKEDLTPPTEVRQKASQYAVGLAKHQNRVPTTLDYLMAVRRELEFILPVKAA
jgi:hypothetical protein